VLCFPARRIQFKLLTRIGSRINFRSRLPGDPASVAVAAPPTVPRLRRESISSAGCICTQPTLISRPLLFLTTGTRVATTPSSAQFCISRGHFNPPDGLPTFPSRFPGETTAAQQTAHRLFVFVQSTEESRSEEKRRSARRLRRESVSAAAATSRTSENASRSWISSARGRGISSPPSVPSWGIFHLARIIYTHALAISRNSPADASCGN